MMWKRLVASAATLLVVVILSAPAMADVNVVIRVAPPAPRVEVVPGPRAGHVWVPGHWAWRSGQHVWVGGHWVRERAGMHWHPSRWVLRNGDWYFVAGGWNRAPYLRDSDHDGVANRFDRDRDNDGVRNRRDRDRDGDGVRNRRDARPDNPNRR
jgi:hypothetical protein